MVHARGHAVEDAFNHAAADATHVGSLGVLCPGVSEVVRLW